MKITKKYQKVNNPLTNGIVAVKRKSSECKKHIWLRNNTKAIVSRIQRIQNVNFPDISSYIPGHNG